MPKTRDKNGSQQAIGADRRRTKRVPLTFQIQVSGIDRNGTPFRERAITTDVSKNGCRFELLWKLSPGDLVAISAILANTAPLGNEPPTIFQVVWIEPSNMGWSMGVTALKETNIWHMTFPSRH